MYQKYILVKQNKNYDFIQQLYSLPVLLSSRVQWWRKTLLTCYLV